MKKTALLIAVSLGLLASCKKSNSGSSSSYHFTATIDGTAQTFNTSPLATRLTAYGITQVAIEGFNGSSSSNIQTLTVGWQSSTPGTNFGVGTWTDSSQKYSVVGVYAPVTLQDYASGNAVTAGTNYAGNHLKITITSIDSTAVKGTFSGDFFLQGSLSGTKKTVTNGDFYVAWKK